MDEKSNDLKSRGVIYGMTKTPSITPYSYSAGPTPEINLLLALKVDEGIAAEIHRLHENADPDVVYRWNSEKWALVKDTPEPAEPLPWEHGPGAKMVLKAMNIDDDENVMLVTLNVMTITTESKVRPKEYEQVQLRQEYEPQDLQVHIPIYEPDKLVDDATGNAAVLRRVHEILARQLDGLAFQIASERVDRQTAKKDQEAAVKTSRFDAGKGVSAKKTGEVL